MPTYEYKCTACGHVFERVQRMTDKPVTRCEKCGKKVEKVFYAVPIVFSGSGFHINDYAPDKMRGDKPKPESESKPETKTVPKPEPAAAKTPDDRD